MEDYKPNSHRSKLDRPEKKVEKVVKGTAKLKKKNEITKFKDVFISEDARNVKSYVLMDVLVPAIKKALSDIVTNGIDMILYGETGRSNKKSPASSVSYRSYYDRRDDDRRYSSSKARTGYSSDDVVLDDRREAEEVLIRMGELIELYGFASVADLYDLVGVTSAYTDNNYGWTNTRNAEVIHVSNGYMIRMPKPLPID